MMKRHVPSEEDGRVALRDHVLDKAEQARARHGVIDAAGISDLLADRDVARFPTALRFATDRLQPGELAWAEARGDGPSEGYVLHVHPRFRGDDVLLPRIVAYHLVRINYGDIARPEEAELFGATLLGLDVDEYYESLCAAADGLLAEVRP